MEEGGEADADAHRRETRDARKDPKTTGERCSFTCGTHRSFSPFLLVRCQELLETALIPMPTSNTTYNLGQKENITYCSFTFTLEKRYKPFR
jgi:hypothetical protein